MDDMKMSLSRRVELRFQRLRGKLRFFIGSRLPDAGIKWKSVKGGKLPVCPRCGDYVYYERQCTQCGQHFLPGARTIGDVLSEVMKDGSKF